VNKLTYGFRWSRTAPARRGRAPRRGDVIAFRNPTKEGPDTLVKRVVGLPGDRIGMAGGRPIINDWKVPVCDAGTYLYASRDGVLHGRLCVEFLDDQAYLAAYTAIMAPFETTYEVKENEFFVLGDNRSNSVDSRAWNGGRGGAVALNSIDGRVQAFLTGTARDGSMDFGRVFKQLGTKIHLEGTDTRPLEQGIEACLKNWPSETHPPSAKSAATANAHDP
jgi:signal peptidase I